MFSCSFAVCPQAHDTSVRAMIWSHNDQWMLTADHTGFVKYWQSNMNNVKMYQAHKDPIRDLRCVGNPQPFCLALVDKCRVMYQIFDYLKLVFYLCSLIDMLTLYVLVQDVFTLTLFVLNLRKCVFAFHIFPRHWKSSSYWNLYSWKTRYISCTVNIMNTYISLLLMAWLPTSPEH